MASNILQALARGGGAGGGAAGGGAAGAGGNQGRAVQVDPIKPKVKAPGTKRLTLKCDEPLSSFDFKFNLRRYTKLRAVAVTGRALGAAIGFIGVGGGSVGGTAAPLLPKEAGSFTTSLFSSTVNCEASKMLSSTLKPRRC